MQLTDPGPLLAKHERSFFKKFTLIDWVGVACPTVASGFNAYYGNMTAAFWAGMVTVMVMLVTAKQQHVDELEDQSKLAIEQRNAAMQLLPNPFERVLNDFEKFINQNAPKQDKKKETQH